MITRHLLIPLCVAIFAPGGMAAPVEMIPAELHGAIQPQVAVAPSGRIHVAFGKEDSVYYVTSVDGGRSFSEPEKVGDLPKLALGKRRGPRISATDQVVAITAISHQEGNLHSWSSDDGGASWKAGADINDVPKSAREGLHAMAGDGSGRLLVTWLDHRNKGTELWSATSMDGGATWGANRLVYQSPDGHICECCHPGVAMDSRGGVAVMWRNWLGGSRDMYMVLSSDGGRSFGPARKLGTGTWVLKGCPMDGGAIALGNDRQPITTSRRETTVFAAGSEGAEQRLASPASQSIVVSGKSGPYFLWESGGGLMLQKPAAAPTHFARKGSFAHAAAMPDGSVIVVWQSEAAGANTLLAEMIDG